MNTKQIEFWKGDFGKKYTDRNSYTFEKWDNFYIKNFGITKIQMNETTLKGIDKSSRILEVGCNIGMQLRGLSAMGFTNLYGIEVQEYAVEKAKILVPEAKIIVGSGLDIPFEDNLFDIVLTSGVLIHIDPIHLPQMMDEIYRCSSKYIWGWEYFTDEFTEINYRYNKGYLWKGDYSRLYMDRFPDLELLSLNKYPYITEDEKGNVDAMFLLSKN